MAAKFDIEHAAQEIKDDIARSPAMDPKEATKQQSVDFLDDIIEHCEASRAALKDEIEGAGG